MSYRGRNPGNGNTGNSDKPAMVAWVDQPANRAFVGGPPRCAEVGVVRPQYGQPYLRTYADGQWINNCWRFRVSDRDVRERLKVDQGLVARSHELRTSYVRTRQDLG